MAVSFSTDNPCRAGPAAERPRLLVLAETYPGDTTSGRHLRIYHLLRGIESFFQCVLVYLHGRPEDSTLTPHLDLATAVPIGARPERRVSALRAFRLSNVGYVPRAYPQFYARLRSVVGQLVDCWQPLAVVNFGSSTIDIGPRCGLPCVLDWSDSTVLTIQRRIVHRGSSQRWRERALLKLARLREARLERHVVDRYDRVLTISEGDRQQLIGSSGRRAEKVSVVPNGVADFGSKWMGSEAERSVVFWGNLDFAPNWTALQHFHKHIFGPYLRQEGVRLHVIGGGDAKALVPLRCDEAVSFHGFVRDLPEIVSRQGVMVNPMVEGSGMKNKLLEALSIGIPAVTTSIGKEGISVVDGRECLVADSPAAFAKAVLRLLDNRAAAQRLADQGRELVRKDYTWDAAAQRLAELLWEISVGTDEPSLTRSKS